MIFEHNNCCGPNAAPGQATDLNPAFEGDLLEQKLGVDIDRNVFATVFDFGVTDRIDLGVVIPFVKLDMHTRVSSRILRTATAADPTIHKFDELELATRTTYASAHPRGIGDIVVRGKVQLVKTDNGGIAIAVNANLPTGDEEELLGTGAFRTEARFVWSDQFGRVGAHLNGGYTTSGGTLPASFTTPVDPASQRGVAPDGALELPDEITVVGGIEYAVAPRVGISGDIIARQLRNVWTFEGTPATFPGRGPGGNIPSDLRALGQDNVLQTLAGLGMRVHLGRPLLLSVDVVLPITGDGLMPKTVIVGGFNLAF
jgi:hypothetical protein